MDINTVERFVKAQNLVYPIALKEIRNGKKRSHWMWYMFPQLRGLGVSSISRYYGITGLDEAKEYIEHPVLSERLYELCNALLEHKDKKAYEILGDIDAKKLHSSMTLFALISKKGSIFHQVIDAFFDGERDIDTLDLIY